jgi:hypothetical protein
MTLVVALTAPSTLTAAAADPVVALQLPSPGASPVPTGVLIDPLDPRAGAGANRVGAPLLALAAVLGIGVVAAALTAVYVRVVRAR